MADWPIWNVSRSSGPSLGALPVLPSAFNYKSDVVGGIIVEFLPLGPFPSAVIMSIGADTINDVSAGKTPISERFAVERIGRNLTEESWNEFFQVFGQLTLLLPESLHGQRGGCEPGMSLHICPA